MGQGHFLKSTCGSSVDYKRCVIEEKRMKQRKIFLIEALNEASIGAHGNYHG